MKSLDRFALSFAGTYLLFGLAWVFFSDAILLPLAPDVRDFSQLDIWKGSFFILLTSYVIYLGSRTRQPLAGQVPGPDTPPGRPWILLLACVSLVAVVLLTGVWGASYFAKEEKAEEMERLEAIASLKAHHIADWLRASRENARILGSDEQLDEMYWRWQRTGDLKVRDRLVKRLRNYQDSYGYSEVALVNSRGEILLAGNEPSTIQATPMLRMEADHAIHTGKLQNCDFHWEQNADTARAALDFVAPLEASGPHPHPGKLAVLLRVDPQQFLFPFLRFNPFPGSTPETLLVRRDGDEVLYLTDQPDDRSAPLGTRASLSQKNQIAVQIVQGLAGEGGQAEGLDSRQKAVSAVGKPIPGTGWFVVTALGQDEIRDRFRHNMGWIALAYVLAVIVIAMVAILVFQRRELHLFLAQRRHQEERMKALQLLEAIADGSEDAIFAKDTAGKYQFVNQGALRVLNKSREEVIGRDDTELFPADTATRIRTADQEIMQRNQPCTLEEPRFPTPDGPITLLTIKSPLHDSAGNVAGVFGIGRDITARKEAEEMLRWSEARLAGLVASALDGIVTIDQDYRILLFNPSAESIFGYLSEEVFCRHTDVLQLRLADSEGHSAFDPWQASLAKQTKHTLFARSKNGGEITLEASLSRHGVGNEKLLTLILRDVTAQKAADRRLRQLSTAVEQSPVSIVVTDTAGHIEYVNPRFTHITGYHLAEVLGQTPRILKSGLLTREQYQDLWKTISSGGEWSGELVNRKKNGEEYWAYMRIIPILSEHGKIMNYMAAQEDITAYKEQQRQKQEQHEQMLHTARLVSMGEMAAALAHELNQPLTAIANFCGVAEVKLSGPKADPVTALEAIRLVGSQAIRAGDIVWRIRDFIRKDRSLQEPVQIDTVIRNTVELLKISQRDQFISIDLDLATGLPAAQVDRVQIEQVLFNLIKNGVEAMERISQPPRLEVAASLAGPPERILVEVRDYGCGLPDPVLMDIFAPFKTTKPGGMGMGLAICRGIIEAHGGQLWAESDGGRTSFFFTLPLAKESE